jgi:glycosyltransferase involved in cell wall biosynthesis
MEDVVVVDEQAMPLVEETTDAPAGAQIRYVMVSSEIRRDLQHPLSYFRRLDIVHLYRSAPWNDMKAFEFDDHTIRFRWPIDLFVHLWRARPQIVQGPEPLSLLMLPYLCATLLYLWLRPQVKLVTLSLEPIPLRDKYHPLAVPVFRAILWFWFRRATVIFWFDSGSHRNLLANGANPAKLVNMIYGSWGVDLDEFHPSGESIVRPSDDPVVLYVGRLDRVKGVHDLLDAFKILRDGGTSAHLAIVGDGPERDRLQEQSRRLGIEPYVTWYGGVKNADLPPYMRVAEYLVLPSISTKLWVQQLSITAWQAMACGLPVIATRTGCMEEFTPPEVGLLPPERNPAQFAAAMQTLLTMPERRASMSAAARAYAERRFDARRNVETAERVILEWCDA